MTLTGQQVHMTVWRTATWTEMQAEEAIIHKVDQTIILRTAQGGKHIKQAERSVIEKETVFLNAV